MVPESSGHSRQAPPADPAFSDAVTHPVAVGDDAPASGAVRRTGVAGFGGDDAGARDDARPGEDSGWAGASAGASSGSAIGASRHGGPASDPDAETSPDSSDALFEPVRGRLDDEQPELIGPYRVLSALGRGGMGSVYLAVREDDRFQKRVAVKLVRRGLDTDEALARFDLERQVLGALNHPNIARLHDAGCTDDGRPYFVMEYVEGKPIDRFCDDLRLPIPRRVELFRKVCAAVQYAHQNLIVHRDIKPSNILVSPMGEPKLLDFGIAKLLSPEAYGMDALTRADQRLMTYEYASPEQVQGLPLTTASDVYSLGVLLYELLTGRRPYQITRRVHEEIARIICDSEPLRPSTAVGQPATQQTQAGTTTVAAEEIARRRVAPTSRLRRALTGDLDNIVLMALRKSPHRRYTSPDHLAEDLSRYLSGEPVIARGDGAAYKFMKFVTRHRGAVAAASVVAVSVLAGGAATAWQWQRAEGERAQAVAARDDEREARQQAEERFEQLRRMARLLDEIDRDIERAPGATAARKVLSSAVVRVLDDLAASFGEDAALRGELAAGYRRAGSLAAGPTGATEDALRHLDRAVEISSASADLAAEEAAARIERSAVRRVLGRLDEAAADARRAGEVAAAIGDGAEPGERDRLRAAALLAEARVLGERGDAAAEAERLERAAGLAAPALKANADDVRAAELLASIETQSGRRAERLGELDASLAAYERALALRSAVSRQRGESDVIAQQRLIEARLNLGAAQMFLSIRDPATGAYAATPVRPDLAEAAERTFVDARAAADALFQQDPFSATAFRQLAETYNAVRDVYFVQGLHQRAVAAGEAAIARLERASAADPLNAEKRRALALARARLGETFLRLNDANAALAPYLEAVREYRELLDLEPSSSQYRFELLRASTALGMTHYSVEDLPAARRAYEEAVQAGERLQADNAVGDVERPWYGTATRSLGQVLVELGEGRRALELFDRADALLPTSDEADLEDRAEALHLVGRSDEALALAERLLESLRANAARTDRQNRVLDRLAGRVDEYRRAAGGG